ncbi:UDP-N-acetylmuramoyl-tripeptide--D-alanyl-D-alanine ligase [Amycolatopsis acidiphila]|uniref:UDP-N-acetylmuramoyl-tripeptide--D-alanyl-D-alanine ligase n=1 Tax=Amycolatopsis acidiphila TaxID=715473 RepID=A0A558ABF8_9PSEU|nr:UDP-N-acetylmuramoyl-tripeptide--D-alanyl-D-alanine ligase [Amycolatopsis acidiphila]TVT21601.1 UDP-N-acetylmuramoyl-tripeptide--D-alanyl-D-alanine ligase [Amycolatopsis acidiphila]UIJ62150.1 UDP-N-acetylmuramoyl-tripeptide--D-alanyl-D-alanine ligase [Amycolatopsis acidiphila]GHG92124.1 UDP-N-acetylmuramoyl-tripeptide--D-alanyl-D-alanine ligase [Amycolatopsis acidiphila]
MISLTLAEIASIVGGTVHDSDGTAVVSGGVEFDSRKIGPGGLFLALPGEKADGHTFARQAVEAGAAGVLAARPVGVPAVVVPPLPAGQAHERSVALTGDTDGSGAAVLAALGKLARYVVRQLSTEGLTVVGVTGSSGKTSTKDLIAQLLEPLGPTVAPPGSFNNELGHPWTALRADESTRHLVLEMSARGPGHIAELAVTAPPRIGVVLNVGSAHVSEFGSREAIAQAKGELVEALPEDGVAVLNLDDPLVAGMASRTKARVVGVGEHPDADVRAEDIVLDEQARPSFRLVTAKGDARVTLGLHGEHHVGNALSAAAVALELGSTVDEVATRLSTVERRSTRRMEVVTRADGVTILNDSYNANPESVRAALKTLASMSRGRRSWAVLGVMGELGADSVTAHDEIGRLAVRLNIGRLVVVGSEDSAAAPMHFGASHEGSWGEESVLVPDTDAATALLRAELEPGDVVLVKASNFAQLWRVANALLEDGVA